MFPETSAAKALWSLVLRASGAPNSQGSQHDGMKTRLMSGLLQPRCETQRTLCGCNEPGSCGCLLRLCSGVVFCEANLHTFPVT